MGQPPEKSSSICNVKSFFIGLLSVVLAIVITALITWHFSKTSYGDEHDLIDVLDGKVDEISAEDLRLPLSVEPLGYELTVKTYLPGYAYKADERNLTFDGQVTIELLIKHPVKKISLNSVDLNFTTSKCTLFAGEESIGISSIETLPKFEKIFINLEKVLEANTTAFLKLHYEGPLRSDMSGFYQTTYLTNKGEQRMAAVTQFEPVYARRMVPCFDEPAFKATWKVTVIHPKGTQAVANGIEHQIDVNDEIWVISNFETTPKMSSYLLAIFVSEFEYNELTTKTGVRFRVWSRPEEKNATEYAVKAGVKCLEYYEEYYGIKFPLKKQDMVALPDFSAGAMENWGLITYRENSLLYDPKIYTGSQKRRVAVVIAHELAHQWFGNLVTLKWWNDLWLNEGFATLVEYLGTDEISDGNFRMKEFFIIDALSSALGADSVASTHPMTFRIDKAREVEDSFDTITYEKGGSVLSMIRKTLGEKHFGEAVTNYLKTHQYSNAVADDLFDSLNLNLPESVVGSNGTRLNVTEFAEPWTKQLGYPILTVSKENSTHLKVTQERFKLKENAKEQEKYSKPKWDFKWDVPVWYQQGSEEKMTWMNQKDPLYLEVKDVTILNSNSDGFYRVTYSEELWNEIIEKLTTSHEVFSTTTRVRLIEDAFVSAFTNRINYSIPIRLLGYLENEKEYLPWSAAIGQINELVINYGTDPEKEPIEKFILKTMAKSPARRDASFVGSNYLDEKKFFEVLAAQTIILNECQMKEKNCIGNLTKLMEDEVVSKCEPDQMTSQCSEVAAPFRSQVYCQGVSNGDGQMFEKVFNWFKIERNQVEKSSLQRALACSKDVTVLKKLMLDAMKPKDSNFRLQDVSTLFAYISMNQVAQDFMLNFLLTRWDDLQTRIATDRSTFNRVLNSLTSGIRSKEGLEQLRNFRKATKTAQGYDFSKIEENIGVTIDWREKNMKEVSRLFGEMVKSE